MTELHPQHAKEVAEKAAQFVEAFLGQQFEDEFAEPFDRRYLGIALDWIEELSAMVQNLADRVQSNA
jgi:hypothetical protein